ncbi:MAG: hypothetical protein ACI9TV_002099 [Sulfurimonas sp.]|jgi:uncharacterized protein YyaL (SSP411 family)|uniref:thioredoxin domain-containing protein n=1 Tax=Sulfurimonas sp. TaxID=2022749 RepID=UPI0039E5A883
MKYLLLTFLCLVSLHASQYTNELKYSTSPYLQQHATNPVNWLPWGEEAFKKAKQENKAVFLSIGYSTCHWCHVMEKESFENEEIAKLFNKYFICVKVDREEMPHLDSYYQRVYEKLNGRIAGWPISAFLTYNKKPFYLASYIPPSKRSYYEGLDTLLPKIYAKYSDNFKLLLEESEQIFLKMNTQDKLLEYKDTNISITTLKESVLDAYDSIYSGFGKGKKHPEASRLSLIMDLAVLDNNQELKDKSYEMLDTMALRGLYDHIGGGFFRYAVDAAWEIPHFEKMLYNQAELIPLYVRGYAQTSKKLYKDVVLETIDMLDRRFLKNDLYFSASDADVNGVEGAFFTFKEEEIEKALENNIHVNEITEALEFTINGNFEGEVHLNFYESTRPKGFEEFKAKLQDVRKTKEFPFIDKKINTAWNAMMIEALYSASALDPIYTKKADIHLKKLKNLMFKKGELYHQTLSGLKATQSGLLEDYSFFIGALLKGYSVDFKEEKLDFAVYLLTKAKEKFYQEGIWYLSDDTLKIKADLRDKYYTSPLGKMLQNIVYLASLKSSFEYNKLARDTLTTINYEIQIKQSSVPASAKAFLMQNIGLITLKSKVQNLEKNRKYILNTKYPFLVLKNEDHAMYLACTMNSCFGIDKEYQKIKIIIEEGNWK